MDNKENAPGGATAATATTITTTAIQRETITSDSEQPPAAAALAESKDETSKSMEDSLQEWVSSGTSWGSSWLKSAKEKTYTTFELVKKDLSEFGDVVASEASALASTTVESVRQQAQNLQQIINFEEEEEKEKEEEKPVNEEQKKSENSTNEAMGLSSTTRTLGWTPKLPSVPTITNNAWVKTIVDTVKNIAQENTIEGEDEFTESIYPQKKLARRSDLPHHILYGIQTNSETYTKIPEGDAELFRMWCQDFKLNEYDGEIHALLANCPPMRALYQELVPIKIENMVFWERYFYKVHQAELLARCKADAEKQFAQSVRCDVTPEETEATDSEEKRSTETENLTVDTDLTQGQNSPDRRSATDESWSVCSSTNVDIQELHDELKDGPQTPKADSTNTSDKSDGWINWDE